MSAPSEHPPTPTKTSAEEMGVTDPVLISRTATDYRPNAKDKFEYTGNYQPKYLLVIWAMYIVWAGWYMMAHYVPDYNMWFSGNAPIYGGYDQDYWDTHVEAATVPGYIQKVDTEALKKKLSGEAAEGEGAEGDASDGAAPAAAPAPSGDSGGMSFPGAVQGEGWTVEVE